MRGAAFILAVLVTAPVATPSTQKPPFSVDALKYLLARKEYNRFDWFITCYLGHHPDTAVLHQLQAKRYYEQALRTRRQHTIRLDDCTGGIPRKYPVDIVPARNTSAIRVVETFDNELADQAFASLYKARSLEPGRHDLHAPGCVMAATLGRTRLLASEVKTYVSIFGCDSVLAEIVADFSLERRSMENAEAVVQLLRTVIGDCPHQSRLLSELGKQFFAAGELDSARHYLGRGEALQDLEPLMLEDALAAAALRGDFSAATDIALRRYELTDEVIDLEQAAVCAAAHDAKRARRLYQRVKASPAFVESTSIAHWFFDNATGHGTKTLNRHFFSGELFYLNFPVSYARYRQSGDKRTYYLHKAGAFYAAGVYDSAAYYNLNLLRILDRGDSLGYRTLFNLAAEYYAAGEYALSYTRFLDLYRHFGGAADPAVHYALALNYEKCGDISRARSHFYHVINTSAERYRAYDLPARARERLRRLGGARPVVLR